MKTIFPLLLLSLFACSGPEQSAPTATADGWQPVSLTDWQAIAGGVASPDAYDDFVLEGEFFLGEGQENRIVIRMSESDDPSFSEGGYTINLNHEADQQNPSGTILQLARAIVPDSLPTKAWNRITIRATADYIAVWLNDQRVCDVWDNRFKEGKIVFLASQDLVGIADQFRNFRIQTLSEPAERFSVSAMLETQRVRGREQAVPLLRSSLEGWHKSASSQWTLQDSVLYGQSGAEGGYLISDKHYHDFYLSTEFKIAKEDNSGIFIRQHPDSANVSLQSAIECNIYDHNGFSHVYSTGSIVGQARAFGQLIDYDDWNTFEILAVDEWVVSYVNGKKAADHAFVEGFDHAGPICLQAGLRVFGGNGPSEVWFRNIAVSSLDKQ